MKALKRKCDTCHLPWIVSKEQMDQETYECPHCLHIRIKLEQWKRFIQETKSKSA